LLHEGIVKLYSSARVEVVSLLVDAAGHLFGFFV
jgi:hypothetical protein